MKGKQAVAEGKGMGTGGDTENTVPAAAGGRTAGLAGAGGRKAGLAGLPGPVRSKAAVGPSGQGTGRWWS